MNKVPASLLSLFPAALLGGLPWALVACSPIPELAGVFQAPLLDAGADAAEPGRPPRNPPSDLGTRGDLGTMPGAAPCPAIFGPATSFCYWPEGPGSLSLSTALVLSGANVNCDLTAGKLSVNAANDTCASEFASTLPATWGFSLMKPVHLTFSYSTKSTQDHAILTVTIPSGSMNEVVKVNGVAGGPNVVNVYSPAGVMFTPGFAFTLAGTLKKATLALDWISVWQ